MQLNRSVFWMVENVEKWLIVFWFLFLGTFSPLLPLASISFYRVKQFLQFVFKARTSVRSSLKNREMVLDSCWLWYVSFLSLWLHRALVSLMYHFILLHLCILQKLPVIFSPHAFTFLTWVSVFLEFQYKRCKNFSSKIYLE